MTSPAIKLAKECGFDPLGPQHEAMIERLVAKAQAQALRDAAEKWQGLYAENVKDVLRRMAEELEK